MTARSRWTLTEDGFGKLLGALGPDAATASREYEALRAWLAGWFTWAGGADPEALADITLDRAAKRLAEGERIDNLRAWVRSAARHVLQESYLAAKRERSAMRDVSRLMPMGNSTDRDHACLEKCLASLPLESRILLERYYGAANGGASDRLIPARRQLAQELGISIETLRTRALRLRQSLARCMRDSVHRERSN